MVVATVCFIIAYGFCSSATPKTKRIKSLKKHNVCVLIYEANHLEKAKTLLKNYNEEMAELFLLYSNKTYMSYYKGKWYTYTFKMKDQTAVTLHELEEILKQQ